MQLAPDVSSSGSNIVRLKGLIACVVYVVFDGK